LLIKSARVLKYLEFSGIVLHAINPAKGGSMGNSMIEIQKIDSANIHPAPLSKEGIDQAAMTTMKDHFFYEVMYKYSSCALMSLQC
jgi:hypothetical protein